MTELATREEIQPPEVPAVRPIAGLIDEDKASAIVRWAEAADTAYRLASSLCKTAFVPKAFQNKPEEGAAAILAGAEIGISPMAAFSAFHVIQGQAAPKAITIRAVVLANGHTIREIKWDDKECILEGRRRGEDDWHRVEWSVARAEQAGLPAKNPNWKTQPKNMVRARADAELGRILAADALLGIPYAYEELQDMGTVPSRPVETSGGGISLEDVESPTVTVTPAAEVQPRATVRSSITDAQLTALAIALKENGYTEREKGLAFLSEVTGRPVTSSKELTKAEASKVIDRLKGDQEQAPIDVSNLPIEEPPGWDQPTT